MTTISMLMHFVVLLRGRTFATVEHESIEKIAGRSKFFIKNDMWRKSTRSREEVIHQALNTVKKRMKYNLVTVNREHFVNKLVTRQASSQQVETAVTYAAVGTTAGVIGLVAAAALLWRGLFSSERDEEEEEQVA